MESGLYVKNGQSLGGSPEVYCNIEKTLGRSLIIDNQTKSPGFPGLWCVWFDNKCLFHHQSAHLLLTIEVEFNGVHAGSIRREIQNDGIHTGAGIGVLHKYHTTGYIGNA